MKPLIAGVVLLLSGANARGADDLVQRLALCQESWFEMKDDAVRMKQFAESFNGTFVQKADGHSFAPKGRVLVAGLPVTEAFPESLGMGVGFSVLVDAPFDRTRGAVEKTAGKSLKDCETGDGMRTCGLEIAEQRTLTIMADSAGKSKTTLVGCYYFYEK
jgi:hypothetical protein